MFTVQDGVVRCAKEDLDMIPGDLSPLSRQLYLGQALSSAFSHILIHLIQGDTKRCRLSWLTNNALVYETKCGGRGGVTGSQPMSTAVHRSPVQINFGDLTPYLNYDTISN